MAITIAKSVLLAMLLVGLQAVYASEPAADGPIPGMPGGKMPTLEELLAALDNMDMSDQEKNDLREQLLSAKKIGKEGEEPVIRDEEGVSHVAGSSFVPQFLMLLAMLSILALIFVFFGYKLYKSLTERERKREEKKKSKQLKKKK